MAQIDVEIVAKNNWFDEIYKKQDLILCANDFLLTNGEVILNQTFNSFNSSAILEKYVNCIITGDFSGENKDNNVDINFSQLKINWFVYKLDSQGPMMQIEESDNNTNEQLNIATHLTLPSIETHNLWENLYFDVNIKENLLKYAQTILKFSQKGISTNVINCNRVILLHGPPGSGKTSLCKALAHKLTVKMCDLYDNGVLIEINSHSLFSKWFSESGKLVTKIFGKIQEILENPKLLVCLLIDEVESLAHARKQCLNGNEPSDSIRVVNAVLTQIDQIKRFSNVLIFTTSNITESIDLAFIDRADIKQFLGLPHIQAIYKIYHSCLIELKNNGILVFNDFDGENNEKLQQICKLSEGLSGRSLRKIPFIAYALYFDQNSMDLSKFLDALKIAITHERDERKFFENQ